MKALFFVLLAAASLDASAEAFKSTSFSLTVVHQQTIDTHESVLASTPALTINYTQNSCLVVTPNSTYACKATSTACNTPNKSVGPDQPCFQATILNADFLGIVAENLKWSDAKAKGSFIQTLATQLPVGGVVLSTGMEDWSDLNPAHVELTPMTVYSADHSEVYVLK